MREIEMHQRILTIAILLFGVIGNAKAEIIDFEGASGTSADWPLVVDGDEFMYGGYRFTGVSQQADPGRLVGALVDGNDLSNTCWSLNCPTNNSSTFYTALNDGALGMRRDDGAAFSLTGLTASFVGANEDYYPWQPMILRAVGQTLDGSVVTDSATLPGTVPRFGGTFSFGAVSFSESFALTAFKQVAFFGLACDFYGVCTAFDSNRAQFALDDLIVGTAPVPEPSSALLALLGLSVLLPALRRHG